VIVLAWPYLKTYRTPPLEPVSTLADGRESSTPPPTDEVAGSSAIEPAGSAPESPAADSDIASDFQPAATQPAATRPAATQPVSSPVPGQQPPAGNALDLADLRGFAVHVASFATLERVERRRRELNQVGFPVFYLLMEVDGQWWYRLYVGPYPDRGTALTVSGQIIEQNLASYIRVASLGGD